MLSSALLSLVSLAAPGGLADAKLPPGDYILAQGGYGDLLLEAVKGNGQGFKIEVVGGNAHTCELEGTVQGGMAKLDEGCVVQLAAKADGIAVTSNHACQSYCGARASFDGTYSKPSPECLEPTVTAHVAAVRREATRLYQAKAYPEAKAKLTALLEQCGPLSDPFDRLWIRNDLSVTLHHLGEDSRCLEVLAPLRELAADSDDDVGAGEPAYRDELLKIARAARHNLKLCAAPAK